MWLDGGKTAVYYESEEYKLVNIDHIDITTIKGNRNWFDTALYPNRLLRDMKNSPT